MVKKAEDGDGVVVRLFEAEGRAGESSLKSFVPVSDAEIANLLEEKQSEVALDRVPVRKDEIKTLKLLLKQ